MSSKNNTAFPLITTGGLWATKFIQSFNLWYNKLDGKKLPELSQECNLEIYHIEGNMNTFLVLLWNLHFVHCIPPMGSSLRLHLILCCFLLLFFKIYSKWFLSFPWMMWFICPSYMWTQGISSSSNRPHHPAGLVNRADQSPGSDSTFVLSPWMSLWSFLILQIKLLQKFPLSPKFFLSEGSRTRGKEWWAFPTFTCSWDITNPYTQCRVFSHNKCAASQCHYYSQLRKSCTLPPLFPL